MFPVENVDFDGVHNMYNFPKDFCSEMEQTYLYETEDWGESGDINSLHSDFCLYQVNTLEEGLLSKHQLFSHFGRLDDLSVDILSPLFQLSDEEISKLPGFQSENSEAIEPEKENQIIFPSPSFKIPDDTGSSFTPLNGEMLNEPSHDVSCTKVRGQKLSSNAVIKLASEKFIKSCSQTVDKFSMQSHPYASSIFDLSDEESKDVELVHCLLASAEKVGQQQFDLASKLLSQCDDSSSNTGNPVQRVAYYFSEALREKINRETGSVALNYSGKQHSLDYLETMMIPNPAVTSYYLKVPFSQVIQFTGVQTLVDNLKDEKKVHIIDLDIRGGMHCTVLMHALSARHECPLEHLRITAIGSRSKLKIEETGERLMSFAQSMNLSFSFNLVSVTDMLHLNEDLFELHADEAVAVYSSNILKILITWPDRLERLMRVMRNINPCVMVVTEVEANHNSPVFVNRFIEALFFYGAFFDSMEDCMQYDEPNRMISESMYIGPVIRNILAAEGEERTMRHVNINIWRAFFERFGMVATDLSTSSLYQADVLLENFRCGSSCTLDLDGKSLIIGWKGTPLYSLTSWKFL